MQHLRLAYRDADRLIPILAIQEMARRHYDLDVEVLRIKGTEEYEAALPDGDCDVIIEHLEYLYGLPLRGRNVTLFCAPVLTGDQEMVVAPTIHAVAELAGKRVAIRSLGRPHQIILRLRQLGIEDRVEKVFVSDQDVGRWCQWKKVVEGDCSAAFISRLYLRPALEAGLHILPAPPVPIAGHYTQACLTSFAAADDDLLRTYLKAVIHALAWLKLCRAEALEFGYGETMQRMGIHDRDAFDWRFDTIVQPLQIRPYPTPEAVTNMYAIACAEFPSCEGLNPLALWDLHWLKQLDDGGFIDSVEASLKATA